MDEKLNAEWALNLAGMLPTWADSDAEARAKVAGIVEFVKNESQGAFYYDKYSGRIVQKKDLPWDYVFDVIRNSGRFSFVVPMDIPSRFRLRKPSPQRGTMLAAYREEPDAVLLRIYTGNRREDLAGYDGYGREPDELEVVEGLRNRDGDWQRGLEIKWI